MRRTRKPRRRIALSIVAGLALIAVAAAVPGLTQVPVRKVHVHGADQQVPLKRIEAFVKPYAAWGWVRLPADKLRRDLEQLQWVSSAKVRRQWPLDVVIEIHERRPAARWGSGGLLDQNAVVFDPGGPVKQPLPLLRGPEGTQRLMLQRYREFSARLAPRAVALEELLLDPRGGWSLLLRDGPQLRLGAESMDRRLQRALLALDKLPEKSQADMAYMDLRYPNGFAVAWRSPAMPSPKQGGISP